MLTAGVLASLFAGFMLVCAIAGMAEATNKTAIIDRLMGFPFWIGNRLSLQGGEMFPRKPLPAL